MCQEGCILESECKSDPVNIIIINVIMILSLLTSASIQN